MITRQGPSHMGSDFLVATAPRRSVRFRLLRNPTGTKLQCPEGKRFALYTVYVPKCVHSITLLHHGLGCRYPYSLRATASVRGGHPSRSDLWLPCAVSCCGVTIRRDTLKASFSSRRTFGRCLLHVRYREYTNSPEVGHRGDGHSQWDHDETLVSTHVMLSASDTGLDLMAVKLD